MEASYRRRCEMRNCSVERRVNTCSPADNGTGAQYELWESPLQVEARIAARLFEAA